MISESYPALMRKCRECNQTAQHGRDLCTPCSELYDAIVARDVAREVEYEKITDLMSDLESNKPDAVHDALMFLLARQGDRS